MSTIVIVKPQTLNDTGIISPMFVVAAKADIRLPWGFLRYIQERNVWQIMTIYRDEPVFCEQFPNEEYVDVLAGAPDCTLLVSPEEYDTVHNLLRNAGHTVETIEYNGPLSTSN